MENMTTKWKERYLRLMKEANFVSWQLKTAYLDGITDPHIKLVTAMCLENQRLWCEQDKKKSTDLDMSLEIIRRVIPNLMHFKLVSVQPMISPAGLVLHPRWKWDLWSGGVQHEVMAQDCVAITRKLKENFWPTEATLDDYCNKLITELNQEVLRDLWNNVGTVSQATMTTDRGEVGNLEVKLNEVRNAMHRKSLYPVSWMVVSKALADKGILNYVGGPEMHIIDFPWQGGDNGILMGCRGEHYYESPYSYNPYIFINNHQDVPDPVYQGHTRSWIATRYSKKLITGGPKWFAKIKVV